MRKIAMVLVLALLFCNLGVLTSCMVISESGIQGEKGEKGDRGEKGDTGEQGIQGNEGAQGPQGPQGEAGTGILEVEIVDGKLIITYTDGTQISAGTVIDEEEKTYYDWAGKTIAFYGDSVVGQTNGDWANPSGSTNWATQIGDYFDFAKVYSRGIGGQYYRWGNAGGSVAFIDSQSGNYKNRLDGSAYDDYIGEIPEGCVAIRGSSCSYLRISTMFPESIREEIDCVFVMFHNDSAYGTEIENETVVWESNSTADPEWVASDYYQKYGGDYNISTTAGGIASTIMKLQAVLPHATIVFGTPISGRGKTGVINPDMSDALSQGTLALRNLVLKVSGDFSIPCIDVYSTCGINGLNRDQYICDGIHPNRYGGEMLARSIIAGLKNVMPLQRSPMVNGVISGTTQFAHSTVSVGAQGILGFEAGKTYEYTLTTNYNGKISLYYAYKDTSKPQGFSVLLQPMAMNSVICEAGVPIMGSFTVPESTNDNGDMISLIVIRTYTNEYVSISYSFILNE